MDGLIDRIETGMTTVDDARVVAAMVARLTRYERVLREIAACGDEEDAMRALRALVERAEERHEACA